jgi:hypothetical protein
MEYVEEREFTVRIEVRCAFPEDYAGDDDGFAWLEEFRPLAAEIAQAAAAAVKRRPGWSVRPGNRGRPVDEEITLVVERVLASEK